MFKTVLFPVNDSRETREAAEVVANIVQQYGSRLVLLAVMVGVPEGQETLTMNDHEAIAKLLEGAKAMFAQQNIEAEIIEREGKPAFVICDVADEIDANLIVIGSRGMGLTEEGVSDSVSNQIVNLSPCPVLVVP